MSDAKFDIVFRGDIVPGQQIQDVKQRLAQLFKASPEKIEALFSGRPVPLKRNVDQATAEKYKAALTKAGAQVAIKPAETAAVAASKPTKPKPAKKPTLKERLAQQAAEESASTAARAATQTQESPSQPSTATAGGGGFSLAPPGSQLGEADASGKAALVPDISQYSLRPMEGELLDANEKPQAEAVSVDTSSYDLAEAGADVLTESERQHPEPPPVADVNFEVAEVGADLSEADDRPPLPEVSVDTDQFDLAPVGSDMGQQKHSDYPPPPDTSSLTLAD